MDKGSLKLKQEKWRRNQAECESTSQRHELQNDKHNQQENLFSKLSSKAKHKAQMLSVSALS